MSTERPTTNADSITDKEIEDELCLLDLEDADSLLENVHDLVFSAKDDFPDDGVNDEAARYAAKMTKASITDGTRTGHLRDITAFITQKCGPVEEGFEGRKYSTAVYSRAALKMWYRSIRPNESLTEWHLDPGSNTWRGLPTRSRHVSQFMVGLEKTKAKSGEVSSSARALSLDDIHSLHDWCMKPGISLTQRRSGIIRYLMLLRIDEIIKLQFENIDKIVGERLNTRKSAQTGLLHSWRLFANDDDPKICPVRGLILLATLYKPQGVEMTGPLFLRTASVLSRSLSKDLQDLGYASWALYGTHSFRRGGCQYRIKVRRWSVDMVAAWGGWSQIEAVTMFRYFYSPNDNHEFMQEYDRN
ncbi:hypothetical protein C8J57DRAFT_1252275 [Mycena rebaudengoi]|nr:hypothetical protein C8J57DRAFT_1252275 [Mycena rebaudengoi]